ncbi:hypothetical protein [uncultured Clostridium sp.]|uniref:hypothetical protein n=1 Tax=uncultured Clostridium sp. TaxID=59620 RepID=UPI0028EE8894|nr:hypothetical protein [uncultured Clostridium sp.]
MKMNNMLSLDKKLELWEKSLPQEELVLLTYAIKNEVKKLDELINSTLDNCYGAAIGDYTDLSIEGIKKIIKRAYDYMEDSKEFIKESGMDWMNKIEKFEKDVKQFLRKEMTAGTLKSDAITKAKKKFDIPAKDISNLWLIIKEEEYPEKCINFGNNKEKGKMLKKAYTEVEKESNAITPKEVEKPIEINKKTIQHEHKIISKETVVEAKFGVYKISLNGVQANKEYFKDVEALEAYKHEELKAFNARIDEIKTMFDYM